MPSAKGRIDGHSSAKCILTWRREEGVEKWSDAQQPRMLLVLDFRGDTTKNEKRTLTRLIGQFVVFSSHFLRKNQVQNHITSRSLQVFYGGVMWWFMTLCSVNSWRETEVAVRPPVLEKPIFFNLFR